jgi:hypothetical protein
MTIIFFSNLEMVFERLSGLKWTLWQYGLMKQKIGNVQGFLNEFFITLYNSNDLFKWLKRLWNVFLSSLKLFDLPKKTYNANHIWILHCVIL